MSKQLLSPPSHWLSWLGVGILHLLGRLPLPLLWLLGSGFGAILYLAISSRRRVALKNISVCFSELTEKQQNTLARQHFRSLGVAALSTGLNWRISERRLKRLVKITHPEILDHARENGQNVILLAPHFLALEIGGIRLAPDYPMVSMYQTIRNPVIDKVVKAGRCQFGLKLVERNAPLRSLIKMIRHGRVFYYLPDQDAGKKRGVFAPFCGISASTVAATGKMATMSRAVIIPTATYMKPFGMGYELRLESPLDNFPSGNDVTDATIINQTIEHLIQRAPAQYFWVHKRFKTRPEGEAGFYDK